MSIQILQDVAVNGGIQFLDPLADFPANPAIGTMVLKDTAIYAYINLGGMETWYPFANRTNSYIHTQGLPALTWYINHNLHTTDVWVQVKDTDGKVISATVTVVDQDNVTVVFTNAIIGTAVVVAPDSINVPEIKASLITVGPNVEINTNGVLINGSYALTSASIDQQIADAIAVETTNRTSADNSISANLAAEVTARTNADNQLQSSINSKLDQAVKTTSTPTFAGLNTGSIVPTASNTFDLGSSANEFKDVYVSGNVIFGNEGHLSYNTTSNSFTFKDELGANAKISLAANSTDDLSEGTTNKYFTTARAASAAPVQSVSGKTGAVTLTSSDVGLGNVNNTSDLDKPISNATQTALNNKLDSTKVGVSVASLVGGVVPTSQLPSYVDDILEYANLAAFPATGESGKIYVAVDTNKTYRWSGSTYVATPTGGAVDSVNGMTGVVTITNITGNAGTATALANARSISLGGDVSGTASFNGTANITITATVADDSHSHSNYQPIDADLTAIAGLAGTSGLLKKTAANTWTLDTTAYSTLALGSTAGAALAASGSAGTATTAAKSDHVHPYPTATNIGAEPTITTLSVSKGGTGVGTLSGIVKGNGTSNFSAAVAGTDYMAPSSTINIGTTNIALNRTPAAQTLSGVNISGDSGSVGGKAIGTFIAAGGVLYASSITSAAGTAAGTSGQILVSAGSNAPAWTSLDRAAGDTATGFIAYNGTTAASGKFNGSTNTPTGTTRLNYSGNFYATSFNTIGTADTVTAASHYYVETASDGFIRPKTLANVQSEVVTTSVLGSGTANGTVFLAGDRTWKSATASITDDTTTSATYYPVFATASSGNLDTVKVASTKLTFDPSTGQMNATTFNSTSDRNAKTDIVPIENALDTVKRIQGVSFAWKDTGLRSYGYIAQDIEQVLPEVVATDSEGRKSVNYDATIAVLLEAVKTLSAKVDELEAKLK